MARRKDLQHLVGRDAVQRLEGISIRGRVALCIRCIETAADQFRVNSDRLSGLITLLWEFVETDRLDDWERAVQEMVADEEEWIGPNATTFAQQLEVPTSVVQMLGFAVEAGRGNLYADVVDCSWSTLEPTLEVLRLAIESGVPMPSLSVFERSPFTDFHGWGNRVPRSFFAT